MTDDWRDRIVGARMAVDDSYAAAIDNSRFSRQEWGLIMTAVEFDVANPDDDEHAALIADTSNLPDVLPELDRIREAQQMGPGGSPPSKHGGSGVLDALKDALGLDGSGGDVDEETLRAAERLVEGYASELQSHLEGEGQWEEIRQSAAE